MSHLGLNEHHDALVLNYLRFAKFQRNQCLQAIKNSFQDAKDTRLLEDTYTVEEIEDILNDINQMIETEAESELMAACHTNVLLLQQIFVQAQKWHLDLDADLAELENRELLDKVKRWEDSELSTQNIENKDLIVQKKLAPLNEGGPMQLLKAQIEQLNEENIKLRQRQKELETKALDAINEKRIFQEKLKNVPQDTPQPASEENSEKIDAKEVEELSEAFKAVKHKMASELEIKDKNQKELETDLTSAKHKLLEVQHQLNMAEKELEKKFSQTGAYKNFKKMLTNKNDQIKELRQKLQKYDEDLSDNE